jgi:hypothetical protein
VPAGFTYLLDTVHLGGSHSVECDITSRSYYGYPNRISSLSAGVGTYRGRLGKAIVYIYMISLYQASIIYTNGGAFS